MSFALTKQQVVFALIMIWVQICPAINTLGLCQTQAAPVMECRPPEVLWGSEQYTEALDMWAVGCILGELLRHEPLFPGKTELAMVQAFVGLLGPPTDAIWPVCSPSSPSGRLLRCCCRQTVQVSLHCPGLC